MLHLFHTVNVECHASGSYEGSLTLDAKSKGKGVIISLIMGDYINVCIVLVVAVSQLSRNPDVRDYCQF